MAGIITKLKLFIPAGMATATPPLGPILGQYGINTVQFCREFNERSYEFCLFDNLKPFMLTVEITLYDDKTYSILIKKPSVSYLLRVLLNLERCIPHRVIGILSLSDLIKLAKFKFPDKPLFASCNIIKGTARSLGVRIEKDF